MQVRDAVEADAEALADISDSPTDVMRNLVHDRSVRVAIEETADSDADPNADVDTRGEETSLLGFVSFDARQDVVHVTQLEGTAAACRRLLEEPLSFARREGMAVELLVPTDSDGLRDAVEEAGFDERGPGPRFAGQPTVRYRLEF